MKTLEDLFMTAAAYNRLKKAGITDILTLRNTSLETIQTLGISLEEAKEMHAQIPRILHLDLTLNFLTN